MYSLDWIHGQCKDGYGARYVNPPAAATGGENEWYPNPDPNIGLYDEPAPSKYNPIVWPRENKEGAGWLNKESVWPFQRVPNTTIHKTLKIDNPGLIALYGDVLYRAVVMKQVSGERVLAGERQYRDSDILRGMLNRFPSWDDRFIRSVAHANLSAAIESNWHNKYLPTDHHRIFNKDGYAFGGNCFKINDIPEWSKA